MIQQVPEKSRQPIAPIAGCAVVLASVTMFVSSAAEPSAPPTKLIELTRPGKKYNLDELLRKYPFKSVADQLAYEKDREALADRQSPAVRTEATWKRLETVEKTEDFRQRWNMRARSLQLLHSNEAEKFIKRDGFGVGRMPSPSPSYLDLPPAPPIPLETIAELPATQAGNQKVALPATGNGGSLPSLETLSNFHQGGQFNFLNPASFGYVKDREHVAGFQPHQFSSMPQLNVRPGKPVETAKGKERWVVKRLELVSLLKHPRPVAYVSQELPRMEDLKKIRTRPLTPFEDQAVKSLKEGEDLVTEATTNRIRMVGSLRASKQCLSCHEVKRGDLLGSFTYELQRDPPAQASK